MQRKNGAALFGGTRRFQCERKDRAEPFLSGGSARFSHFGGLTVVPPRCII